MEGGGGRGLHRSGRVGFGPWGQSVGPSYLCLRAGHPQTQQGALGLVAGSEAWLLTCKPEHWACTRGGWSRGAGPVPRTDCLAGRPRMKPG